MTGWKKVESNVWRPDKEDEFIEGVLIKREPSTEFDNFIYEVETNADGKIITRTIFGTTVLDDRMKDVQIGKVIKIVYKGEKKVKKGMSKMFDVYVAE